MPKLSHDQRYEQRLQAVEMVIDGAFVSVVAEKFGRTSQWVRAALDEFNVPRPPKEPDGKKIMRAVALLQHVKDDGSRRYTDTEIGRAMGLTRQRIGQIRAMAERAGVKIPPASSAD